MVSCDSSFSVCLEFVSESNISPVEGLDVCHLGHLIYLFFLSLGVMLRVSTVLHLFVAYDDDITR